MLACKGKACVGEGCRTEKAVYGIDLVSNKMPDDPCFVISIEDAKNFLETSKTTKELEDFVAKFDQEEKNAAFNPSAIAVHPKSGYIYMLASRGKSFVVLSPNGKILHIEKLNKKVHAQPEGIVFDKDGTMYIANEGKKDGKGMIHRFTMHH